MNALNNKTESSFANHLVNTNHTFTNIDNNMNILHYCKRGHKLNTLEQFEIYKSIKLHNTDVLNEQTNFKSHTLFEQIQTIDQLQQFQCVC